MPKSKCFPADCVLDFCSQRRTAVARIRTLFHFLTPPPHFPWRTKLMCLHKKPIKTVSHTEMYKTLHRVSVLLRDKWLRWHHQKAQDCRAEQYCMKRWFLRGISLAADNRGSPNIHILSMGDQLYNYPTMRACVSKVKFCNQSGVPSRVLPILTSALRRTAKTLSKYYKKNQGRK